MSNLDVKAKQAEAKRMVELALSKARQLGADQAEVAVSQDVGLSATARLGDVENLEYTNDRGLGITVYRNQCKGNASTSDLSAAAIEEAVGKAVAFADATAADVYSGLADADLMCRDIPDLELDHPWEIDAATAVSMAIACEKTALDFDPRIKNSEGATVSSHRGVRTYGNTHGFLGSVAKTSHSLSCVVLGEQGDEMQRDYFYSAARDPDKLLDGSVIGETAARRAVSRLGAVKPKTTAAPVLFAPELARGFIGHAIGGLSGGAQYRKSTFLLDALGRKVFPTWLSIEEQPHLLQGMASAAYDSEGVATYDRSVVSDGVIEGYMLSSYSARRLGLATTANAGGAQNLVVTANAKGLDELIEEMGTGLLVEELIGQGVNTVTGDYSRGAVGHWVENGKISHPVHEVTIAGNLSDLYASIRAIGEDWDERGGIRCGSLLVDQMKIAGA